MIISLWSFISHITDPLICLYLIIKATLSDKNSLLIRDLLRGVLDRVTLFSLWFMKVASDLIVYCRL